MSASPTPTFQHPLAALTVAGSDSGGGAGIQADLRTFAAHGVLGCTALTAITAQNTLGVKTWEPVTPSLVGDQILAVMTDLPVRAAKTGMLATRAIIDIIAHPWPIPLVVDPVMVSTSGHRLLDLDAEGAMRRLMTFATVVTPNLPEAAVLSGLPVDAPAHAHADALAAMTRATVVIKGGHRRGPLAEDFVRYPDGTSETLSAPWVDTTSTHGTGCTFSAAITANLALGLALPETLKAARAYLTGALQNAIPFGSGHGPVNHLWMLRSRR